MKSSVKKEKKSLNQDIEFENDFIIKARLNSEESDEDLYKCNFWF